jgi:hypothetical protein
MQCLEFRRAVGAEPGLQTPEVMTHLENCTACAEYRRQMLDLDRLVRRALEIPVGPASRPAVGRKHPRWSWVAMAASVLLAVVLGFTLLTSGPSESLAATVVDHIQHEPGSMVATTERVAPLTLDEVLERAGIRLRDSFGAVTYARSCPFRGYTVPHLVVQSQHGPVTVLVLTHETIAPPIQFEEGGLRGTIVPAGPGSIAIVGGDAEVAEGLRARVLEAVQFLD